MAFEPIDIGLFGSDTVMFSTNSRADLIEELWFLGLVTFVVCLHFGHVGSPREKGLRSLNRTLQL